MITQLNTLFNSVNNKDVTVGGGDVITIYVFMNMSTNVTSFLRKKMGNRACHVVKISPKKCVPHCFFWRNPAIPNINLMWH